MESIYAFFSLATLFIFLLFKFANKSHQRLPPGPWKLPILGSVHHLIGSQLPHHRFQELSKVYGPLMHLRLGEVSMLIASSPEVAKELMKTHDTNFATRPLFPAMDIFSYGGKSMSFGPYGENWRQLRKICVLELLSARSVQSFSRIREEEVESLTQSVSLKSTQGSIINLSKMMIEMANKITTRAAVGNKFEYQDEFLATLSEGVVLAGSTDLTDLFPSYSWLLSMVSQIKSRVERCHQKQDEILESVVQDHNRKQEKVDGNSRGELTEDFVDVLLRLQKEGDFELSNDSIKALILDVFGAGSDTSASTMQWTMSELMRNPRAMNKVQKEVRDALRGKSKVTEDDAKELNYLQLVIKETLRLHPPLPLLLPRECQKECVLLGYKIPAKTRVVVNAWAIGRDPQYWEDAEEFKPERFERSMVDFRGTNFELLPFGAGRRMCPGILFGLATMVLPLAQLLYYFDWELPTSMKIKSESLDMSESFGITVHKKFDLLLHATPHISQTENQ